MQTDQQAGGMQEIGNGSWLDLVCLKLSNNYSAHTVHDHSPALDSGFRRNDVSNKPFPGIPAEAGIQFRNMDMHRTC